MGTGRKKIEIKKKEKYSDRMVTFSKRRKGLFKKAQEFHSKTGADIAVLVFSPAGRPYTHGDPSFDATIDKYYHVNSGVQESKDDDDFESMGLWKSGLENLQVEAYNNVEELLILKTELEEIRGKLMKRIDDDFVGSLIS